MSTGPLMLQEIALLSKLLVAYVALERKVPAVYQHVSYEIGLLGESLSALCALKRPPQCGIRGIIYTPSQI